MHTVSVGTRASHVVVPVRASSSGALRVTGGTMHAAALPCCSRHPGSLVRRYRTQGPIGPGVYPQCVPGDGQPAHLLSWADPVVKTVDRERTLLSSAELDVLRDAADGLTRVESASKRHKGAETVKTQRRSILLKLGARNIAQAVAIMTTEGRC